MAEAAAAEGSGTERGGGRSAAGAAEAPSGQLTVRDIDLLISLEGDEAEAITNLERVQRDKKILAAKYADAKAKAMEVRWRCCPPAVRLGCPSSLLTRRCPPSRCCCRPARRTRSPHRRSTTSR